MYKGINLEKFIPLYIKKNEKKFAKSIDNLEKELYNKYEHIFAIYVSERGKK